MYARPNPDNDAKPQTTPRKMSIPSMRQCQSVTYLIMLFSPAIIVCNYGNILNCNKRESNDLQQKPNTQPITPHPVQKTPIEPNWNGNAARNFDVVSQQVVIRKGILLEWPFLFIHWCRNIRKPNYFLIMPCVNFSSPLLFTRTERLPVSS